MSYRSIDQLQNHLADQIFGYAKDRKKAAGRALGTLVELITYYTLVMWDLRDHIVIERSIPEYANPKILHNVEFSLHPIHRHHNVKVPIKSLPLTPKKVQKYVESLSSEVVRQNQILSSQFVKRNSTLIVENDNGPIIANVDSCSESETGKVCRVGISELLAGPFAIVECKRVGVEEGMKKGPQTIEKAKQGAYVARSVSSLQKIRLRDGTLQGVLEVDSGNFRSDLYDRILQEAIDTLPASDLEGFMLTIGVVSNHGNWFTSDDPNKELHVLSQSYDRLLFLTDDGLCDFIELLSIDNDRLHSIQEAFRSSYSGKAGSNKFTKVRIDYEADLALRSFFSRESNRVDSWFNVISPSNGTLASLRDDLRKLARKSW